MRLAGSPWAAGAEPRTTAERTACLWFAQMKAFEALASANVRSLSAAELFGRPAETIQACAGLFGLALRDGEAAEIASGQLFETYSKNPALDYDPEVRAAREAEAKRRLAPQIAEAEGWARAARDRHGLAETLGFALFGDPPSLLA